MKCPRKNCINEALVSNTFGVMPCRECQAKDRPVKLLGKYDASHPGKLHRLQGQRDRHGKDILQPFDGQKPNKEYFEAYPEQVDDYGVREELAKM